MAPVVPNIQLAINQNMGAPNIQVPINQNMGAPNIQLPVNQNMGAPNNQASVVPINQKANSLNIQTPIMSNQGPVVPSNQTPISLNIVKPVTAVQTPINLNIIKPNINPQVDNLKPVNFNIIKAPIIPTNSRSKPETPIGQLLAMSPTIPQLFNNENQKPNIGGFTTVKNTSLNVTIPNIYGKNTPESNIAPQPSSQTPTIKMPTFNTTVRPVEVKEIKRPLGISQMQQIQQRNNLYTAPGVDNITEVLNEMDADRLISGRIRKDKDGDKKEGYSLQELKGYAERLGISVSKKHKQELIDSIQAIRREMGVI